MTTNNAIVYIGQIGADTYVQSLNGVLYTEDQIGFMADRILWTEGQIGDMANRIVYVTELSQNNLVIGQYLIVSLAFAGLDSAMNNMYKYYVTVQPSYIPWRKMTANYNTYNDPVYRSQSQSSSRASNQDNQNMMEMMKQHLMLTEEIKQKVDMIDERLKRLEQKL